MLLIDAILDAIRCLRSLLHEKYLCWCSFSLQHRLVQFLAAILQDDEAARAKRGPLVS